MYLYERIAKREEVEHQHMDEGTLLWLKNMLGIKQIKSSFKGAQFSERQLLSYLPKKERFLNSDIIHSIHGIRHIGRVVSVLLLIINNNKNEFTEKETEELLVSGMLHDVRRQNDLRDIDHGSRAALWLNYNKGLFLSFRLVKFDLVQQIIKYHNMSYEYDDQRFSFMLKIFKSADALDRYRLADTKRWPDYNRMYYEFDEQWIYQHKCFVYLSEKYFLEGASSEEALISAAKDVGFCT